MGDTHQLDHARQMDKYFRSNAFLDLYHSGAPIDERSLIDAANDPDVIPAQQLIEMQTKNAQIDKDHVKNYWANHASLLSDDFDDEDESKTPTRTNAPILPPPTNASTNRLVRAYSGIVRDVKNFKNLPYDTNMEKLDACFLKDNRIYITVTSLVVVIILIVLIIVLCVSKSRK